MKEFFIILFIVISVIAITILTYLIIYLKKMTKLYYKQHVLAYSQPNSNSGKIIFIGDSHTEFYKTNIYLNKYNVLNFGIAGDTTTGVINRLKQNVLDYSPKKVFIQIGINDFQKGLSKEQIYNNIITIANKIKKELPNTNVYIISLYPINKRIFSFSKFVLFRRRKEDINSINEQLEESASANQYTFINIAPILKNGFGDLAKQYTVEGLHLNSNAYKTITDLLVPYIIE